MIFSVATVACMFFALPCRSADDAAAKKSADEVFQAYSKAFAAADAKAIAGLWKNDGEIVDEEGMRTVGRTAIEEMYAAFFKEHPGSKATIELRAAKPDGEGVIVADICPKIDPPISKAICEMGAMVVLVKGKDGKWLIEGVREKNAVPASYAELKPLEWLVGDWTVNPKKAPNTVFSIHCHWTENKSFLICMYTAKHQDVVRHGTEVIGWDPKEKKIRSWMFDSNGGFAQGSWKKDGNRWTIELGGVTPVGETAKATQTITGVDADTFTFESKNRMKGEETVDDVPLLEMQRVRSNLPQEPGE
jgi:uncharacterized protein (TIGR02246 family)